MILHELLASITPFLDTLIFAQVSIPDMADKGVDKIKPFALLLGVVGITYGGFKILQGEIQYGLYAILGGLMIALSYPLMKSLFELAQ